MNEKKIHVGNAGEVEVLREPPFPRRVRIWWYQWACLPLLFAIPVLALCGVFGLSSESSAREEGALRVSVEYPSRLRYREGEPLRVVVRNEGQEPLRGVRVILPTAYLESFGRVEITPPVKRAYEVELPEIPGGASERVLVSVEAEEYGWQYGEISVQAGARKLEVPVRTLVFP